MPNEIQRRADIAARAGRVKIGMDKGRNPRSGVVVARCELLPSLVPRLGDEPHRDEQMYRGTGTSTRGAFRATECQRVHGIANQRPKQSLSSYPGNYVQDPTMCLHYGSS